MKFQISSLKLHTKIILLTAAALLVVTSAGYFGYQNSKGPQIDPVDTPRTVKAVRSDLKQVIAAPGQLVSSEEFFLTARVNGWLEEILVRPGDAVEKGQVLARVANRERFEAAVSSANLELLRAEQALQAVIENAPLDTAQAKARLNEAKNSFERAQAARQSLNYPRASQSRLESVSSELTSAEQQLAQAQAAFDDVRYHPEDDSARIAALRALTAAQTQKDRLSATYNWLTAKPTGKDIESADADLALSKAELESAQREWQRVMDGPDAAKIALAEAEYDQKKTQLDLARADLENLEIVAPLDGVILEVFLAQGQAVIPGSNVFKIVNPHDVEVLATVVEEDLPLLKPGQLVELFFDALPEELLDGTVSRIVPTRTTGERALYTIYIALDKVPDQLVPGMTADGSIVIDQRSDVIVLPISVVHNRAEGHPTLNIWNGSSTEERPVKLGLRSGTNVEIVAGIDEGELVVTK